MREHKTMKSLKNLFIFIISIAFAFHIICFLFIHYKLCLYHILSRDFTITKTSDYNASISESYKINTTESNFYF